MNDHQTRFVTGASGGRGLALVKKLLDSGHSVAAIGNRSENFLPREIDPACFDSFKALIAERIQTAVGIESGVGGQFFRRTWR